MFVILEERPFIADAIVAGFEREGVAAIAVRCVDFESWFEQLEASDAAAIEGVLLGEVESLRSVPAFVHSRCQLPVIGVLDSRALNATLELFAAGVNDVVVKPFHPREILARVAAIRRRTATTSDSVEIDEVCIFFDGRDPIVNGLPLELPRRERRILEYLVMNRNARVTKTQIFNRVYGIFNEEIHENVVESHISRLRKRLRDRLSYDPIDSQRYLGYRFMGRGGISSGETQWSPSLTQGRAALLNADTGSHREKLQWVSTE